jgi:hypothetical protein
MSTENIQNDLNDASVIVDDQDVINDPDTFDIVDKSLVSSTENE